MRLNLILTLAILVAIGYALYKLFGGNGPLSSDNPQNQDPTTGQYIGAVNSIDNWIDPVKFPGQTGEVVGTSQTYTGAAAQVIAHPLDSMAVILGIGQNGS